MEVTTKPWYIDAWSVHDGRVFASRREPDSVNNYVRTADTTVFMSVPDLQAVPVGRISTALRATRSGFQDKFREVATPSPFSATDEVPAEIAFDDLAQIRDLVRRGYLASELGPGSPGAVAGPVPGPDITPGPGGAFIARRTEDRLNRPVFLDEFLAEPSEDLDEALYIFAQASILEWDELLADNDPERLRAFIGWCAALARTGVLTLERYRAGWSLDADVIELLGRDHDAPYVARAAAIIRREFPPLTTIADSLLRRAYWTRGHLATVPLPRAPGWNRRLTRLVEMQLLPIVDRRFWREPRTAIDLAPLLLVTLVRHPGRIGQLSGEASMGDVGFESARQSLKWVDLPGPAEGALEHFIDACIAGSNRPTPTPTPTRAETEPVEAEVAADIPGSTYREGPLDTGGLAWA